MNQQNRKTAKYILLFQSPIFQKRKGRFEHFYFNFEVLYTITSILFESVKNIFHKMILRLSWFFIKKELKKKQPRFDPALSRCLD